MHTNRYNFLIYESRQGEASIEAETPKEARDKLFRYDLRHGDDDSIPLKVQPEVTVNRYGTVFTAEPIFMEGEFPAISTTRIGTSSQTSLP